MMSSFAPPFARMKAIVANARVQLEEETILQEETPAVSLVEELLPIVEESLPVVSEAEEPRQVEEESLPEPPVEEEELPVEEELLVEEELPVEEPLTEEEAAPEEEPVMAEEIAPMAKKPEFHHKMSKDELFRVARAYGLTVDEDTSKKNIIKALEKGSK